MRLIEAELTKFPTRWKAAEHFGISESSLSKIMRGQLEPGPVLLSHFGLITQTIYVNKHTSEEVVNSQNAEIETFVK